MKNRLLEYKEDYIDEGSFAPLKQVMIGVFFMSYIVGLPAELRHLRHEEEMKRQGALARNVGRCLFKAAYRVFKKYFPGDLQKTCQDEITFQAVFRKD